MRVFARSCFCIAMGLLPLGEGWTQDDRRPPPPVVPKPDDPALQPEGNWYIESSGWEKNQVPVWAVVLKKLWKIKSVPVEGGRIWYWERQETSPWTLQFLRGHERDRLIHQGGKPKIQGAGMEVKWDAGVYGDFGGTSRLQQTGVNEIRGEWKYGEKAKGNEVWRRTRPRWTRLVFTNNDKENFRVNKDEVLELQPGAGPGRIAKDYNEVKWWPRETSPGNRPRFFVEIYGEDLWGHHWADAAGALDLEVKDLDFIQDDKLNTGRPPHVLGLRATVLIWPNAKSGRQELRVDGVSIPFDFVIRRRIPSQISPGLRNPNDIPEGTGR